MDFKNEKWVHIDNNYELSNYGRLRRLKRSGYYYLIPSKHFSYVIYFENGDKKTLKIEELVFEYLNIRINMNTILRNAIIKENKKLNSQFKRMVPPKTKENYKKENPTYSRSCHDCGKPTNQYRCDECWQIKMESEDMDYLSLCSNPDSEYRSFII